MTNSYAANRWDQRYGADDYFYGTEPNNFLREHAAAIPAGGTVLCIGEGEGRNATYLAALGYRIVAVDASSVGLAKARRLATERGVQIDTVEADLEDFDLGRDAWDGIVSIWCHLFPPVRSRVHGAVLSALRPGGAFLLEAYTPAQLQFRTGGPQSVELLATLEMLRAELAGLVLEFGVEHECDVYEGRAHRGHSAVVDIVARRAR